MRRALIGLVLAAAAAAEADELAARRAALQALEARIAAVLAERRRTEGAWREAEATLARTARALQAQHRRWQAARRARDAARARLEELRAEQAAARAELEAQRARLAAQLRAAYFLGRQDRLRLLFEQDEATTLARLWVYHRHVLDARRATIAAVEAGMRRLARAEAEVAGQLAQLEAAERREAAESARLERLRAEQRRARAALAAALAEQDAAAAALEEDRARLEALIAELAGVFADLPAASVPFAELRGRLPWPAAGRPLAPFGAPRDGGLRWQGWALALRSAEVRAVARGRVAFADWLPGYGLVLILDHNDGYLSLYAHNEALYKEAGDWVEAGELIAAAGEGERGGRQMYFELRRDGRPLDPAAWLAAGS